MSVIPWSFSSITSFETCARKHYLTRVAKIVKDPPTVHTEWGKEVHTALELRVRDKTPLPEPMQKWEPLAAAFDTKPGVFAETQFALTRNLKPTGWFDGDAWCRGIIDVGAANKRRAFLGDWKTTGKIKHDVDQLKLFSAMFMQYNPNIEVVDTGFIWLAHDKITKEVYTRDDLPSIWQDFMARSLRLEVAMEKDKWLPKPSGLCRGWCPAGRDNCEFWSPKKN